jgi:hypothetical protein
MTTHRAVSLVMAGTLVLAGGGCGDDTSARPEPAARAATAAAGTPAEVPRARRAPSVVVAEAPALATLPSGRQVVVRPVGTTAAGLLDVPSDIDQAGWWRGGSRLGDPFGSTLVAAHVDSRTQGLGPFAELLTVPRGARVVLASEHLAQTFEVRSRRLVRQGSLADETWLFDVSGARRLTLVTCAPPYDASRGGYQNLAVITAVPVSSVDRR